MYLSLNLLQVTCCKQPGRLKKNKTFLSIVQRHIVNVNDSKWGLKKLLLRVLFEQIVNAVTDHSVVEAWWSSGCPVCVSDSLGVEVCLRAERSPQRGWRSMEAPNGHCCRGPSKPSSDCARVIRVELGYYHCRLAGLEGFPHPTGTMLTPAERGGKKTPVLAFCLLSVHLAEHSLCRHFWVCFIGYFF